MSDGVVTQGDIYLPDDGGRHPVLLSRTPYTMATSAADTFSPIRAARRGFAVALLDCRGRGRSAGEFTPFDSESSDGADAVAWCRSQPWSNGRVGMFGPSYLGATLLLAAVASPPGLTAISPVQTASCYGDGWVFESGVLQQAFAQNWAFSLAAARVEDPARSSALAEFSRAPDSAFRPVREAFGRVDGEPLIGFYQTWMDHQGDDAWWARTSIVGRYGQITCPGLHVGGWYDIFLEGTLENYVGLRAGAGTQAARDAQFLVVGPWEHGRYVDILPEGRAPARPPSRGVDVGEYQLDFFQHHLLGQGWDPGWRVRVFVTGAGEWQDLPDWPPADTAVCSLYLSGTHSNSVRGDGALVLTPPSEGSPGRGEARFLHDPQRPVPTRGGGMSAPGQGRAGPTGQGPVEDRDDVLVYSTDPLRTDTLVMGTVRAELEADSTASSFDLCVKLVDVDPSGRAINVADGVRRVVKGSRPTVASVTVGSVAHCFRRGHRIRLDVAGSNFPRLERHPDGELAIHSLVTGASRVCLPVRPPFELML
jgi:putative CocE/NonD family hydrolase